MKTKAATRTVTIPACLRHEGRLAVRVTVAWFCPVCGGPRGDVRKALSFDADGRGG